MSFGPQQGDQEPPWAKELFQQQAEILQKLKTIRACFKCRSLTHLVRDYSSHINPGQGNLRRAGYSQK